MVFVRFLHCKVTLPHAFHAAPFGKKSLNAAYTYGMVIYIPPPQGQSKSSYINSLEFFCMRDLSVHSHLFIIDFSILSHLSIYPITYLYQSILMYVYFILLVMI